MDFKSKLQRLSTSGLGGKKKLPPSAELVESRVVADETDAVHVPRDEKLDRISKIRSTLGQMMARDAARASAHAPNHDDDRPRREVVIPGATIETAHGPLHEIRSEFEPNSRYGKMVIAKALAIDARALATIAIDPSIGNVDISKMLFIDTETTGLSGGTGTIPFLIGLGWFEGETFIVEQLFLRKLGEEAPMLARVAEKIRASSMLVSFNGKSFDWPLLRTRFVLSRIPAPELPPHLDLLHCSRRIFKKRLDAMRLVHLEERILGREREDDLPGSEVPAAYLAYLKRDSSSRVADAISHNANDIVALAAILASFDEQLRTFENNHPLDQLAFAHVAVRAKDETRAFQFASSASESGDAAVESEAHALLAKLHKKSGKHEGAAAALQKALIAATRCGSDERVLHLALAKLYEQKLHDYVAALSHAKLCVGAEADDDSERRVARLEKKLAKQLRHKQESLLGQS